MLVKKERRSLEMGNETASRYAFLAFEALFVGRYNILQVYI